MKPRAGVALTSVMMALTLTTGMIEAVSFLVLGPVFTAVQKGNLLFLAFALAGATDLSPAASGVSIAGFAVGTVLGSRLESEVDRRGNRWFVVALLAEAVLLGLGALLAWRTGIHPPTGSGEPSTGRHFAVIALVAGAMGLRNVTALRASVPDVPTTLSTRALTALLSGLPPTADTRIGSGARHEGRRLASVGAMFTGGMLGAWLLDAAVDPAVVLLLTAALALCLGTAHWATPVERTSVRG
ncbi:YoaK family protein [Streptomyces ossamyceticus]|uniref:YoaK family protein n=1 Tax=Streptomyces ossamyceticus TaxID=249581 RepID=UPI0006E20F00|nr:YoaK family protein [Streptomyces ossamyceticus]